MAAPTIVSQNPAPSETNVDLNKILSIEFSEALLSSSVSESNFLLRHAASKTQIRSSVSLDSTGTIVSITPGQLLWKNTTFEIVVIGASSSLPTGNLKAADDSDFATTTTWSFQTGDDIEAGLDKTDAIQEREGDLFLPPGLQVVGGENFELISAEPTNGSWGFTGDLISVTFSREVSTSDAANYIQINQMPFLDEEGWQAAEVSSGQYDFEWNQDNYSGVSWANPEWIYTGNATGTTLYLTRTGDLLANTLLEIYVDDALTDTSGNSIDSSYSVLFTSFSYPNYITPRTVRNEIYHIYDSLNLEFVHQLTWKWMINAYRITGRLSPLRNGFYLRKYVKCGAVMDIIESLWAEKALMAGTTKTLGDFTISYHPSAGDLAKNGAYQKASECLDRSRRALITNAGISWFVKGWNRENPAAFRMRLWKNPRVSINTNRSYGNQNIPASNTIHDRDAKLPGYWDNWS
jgi:hypothetical protein